MSLAKERNLEASGYPRKPYELLWTILLRTFRYIEGPFFKRSRSVRMHFDRRAV